jgi:pyruvate formate lyase activating enzyme
MGRGFCGVRALGPSGRLIVDSSITHLAVQTVERKPLYHFRPGERLVTLGSWGCGTRCEYCRNGDVALARRPLPRGVEHAASEIVDRTIAARACGVAFSFNEPLVRGEQVAEICEAACAAGLETVIVTSGFATDEALALLAPLTSAWRIDIKAATARSARLVFGEEPAPWGSSFMTLRRLARQGVHVEISITYSPTIMRDADLHRLGATVVRASGEETAIHVQPLLPAHRLRRIPPPDLDRLLEARAALLHAGLRHVYIHQVGPASLRTTWCRCGEPLVKRRLTRVNPLTDASDRCRRCGARSPIRAKRVAR